MKNNPLVAAIGAARDAKAVPVSQLTSDLQLAAVMSKLVNDPNARSRQQGLNRGVSDQTLMVRNIADKTAQKIGDARNFLQLLPDLKLGIDILISSVLSPKDMMEVNATFRSSCDSLPSDVLASLNAVSTDYFSRVYKITDLLPKIIRDVLVETGSYAIAVLPENTVDDIINRGRSYGLESYQDLANYQSHFGNLGILGAPKVTKTKSKLSFAFEDYLGGKSVAVEDEYVRAGDHDLFVKVCDNPNLLKSELLRNTLNSSRISSLVGCGRALESVMGDGKYETTGVSLYKDNKRTMMPMLVVKTQDQLARASAGIALKKHIPSEAVIPVFPPGQPSEHVGYFVVLDELGSPLTVSKDEDYYGQLKTSMSSNADATSSMVSRMFHQYESDAYKNGPTHEVVYNAYTDMIENDLNARLKNGMLGGKVKLTNYQQIMSIMLMRSLKQQYTQVLYVPRELMTYVAIDYNEYGIGKSLLDDMKILLSLRVVSTFANTMAAIKNSIGRTEVTLKLDEHDADPWKTIEMVMGELNRVRTGTGGNLPIGASGPAEVVDWLSKAAYEFTFEGHPSIPDVKIDFNETNSNYTKPDSELEEDLRKRSLMAIGIPPELVDNSFSSEFAEVVVTNNVLLSKRVLHIQDRATPHLSEHCRKVMVNEADLIQSLKDVITNSIDSIIERLVNNEEFEYLTKDTEITDAIRNSIISNTLQEYIENFELSLPRPNSVELSNQADAFKTYMESLDETIKYFMDDTFANSDSMGEMGEKVDFIRESLKAMMARQWMAENNYMTELFDLTVEDETGKINRDIYQDISDHNSKLIRAFATFIQAIKPMKEAGDKYLEETGEDETDSYSNDSGDEGGEDTGGEDDFGFDDDMGFEDEKPTEDETTEEETTEEPAADEATDAGTEES